MKTDDNQSPEIIVPLGKALKDARLASKLSIDEVAEKLNLGPCTVYDLEDELTNIVAANKYPVIYLRGYLANYAKLVGLNTLELFVEYQQLESGSKNKPTLQRSTLIIPPTKKRSKLLPISLFVIIVVVALIYLLQQPLLATLNKYIPISDSVPIEVTKTGTTQKLLIATNISQETEQLSTINLSDEDSSIKVKSDPVAVEKVNHETDEPAAEVKEVEVDEAQVIESQVNQVEPKVAVEVESSPPAESEASFEASESNSNSRQELVEQAVEKELATGPESLMLAFNAECWTEVFDATGKRIAFGLYKNGRVLTLSGIAPFLLKLGDPSVVDIQYQDQIIEGEFTPGRSAQFSVPLS